MKTLFALTMGTSLLLACAVDEQPIGERDLAAETDEDSDSTTTTFPDLHDVSQRANVGDVDGLIPETPDKPDRADQPTVPRPDSPRTSFCDTWATAMCLQVTGNCGMSPAKGGLQRCIDRMSGNACQAMTGIGLCSADDRKPSSTAINSCKKDIEQTACGDLVRMVTRPERDLQQAPIDLPACIDICPRG